MPCAQTVVTEGERMDIKIDTINTAGFSMDYCRFGSGKGKLLIIPGVSVQSVMLFADAIAQSYRLLTDDYTIYVLDRKKEVVSTYSVETMARDTAEAVQTLGLEKVCVFGASQGGMIAQRIAIEQPELVQKLILGSTAARMTPERLRPIRKWIDLAENGKAEELYLSFGKDIYPQAVYEQVREQLAEAAKTVSQEEMNRFAVIAEGLWGFDSLEDLKRILCPVLVIGSRDDRVLGGDASLEIAEQFKGRPDCELYMYDGYGHACYDTAPDYRERMLRFLKK